MADRKTLQTILENILGSREVYYNPPESIKMSYPAIVYSKEQLDSKFANDGKYLNNTSYSITLMSRIPDDPIAKKILNLPLTSYNKTFVSENLYHEIITIYY